MDNEEIIKIMDMPKSVQRLQQYHQIYEKATGKRWNKCFCGNGFDTFFKVCKNYSEALKKITVNK